METYRLRKQIHKLPGKVIHAIPLPEPDVLEGHGQRRQIGAICRENGYKQVLLVTDRTLSGTTVAAWYMTSGSQKMLVIHNVASSEKSVTVKDDLSTPVALLGSATLDHDVLTLSAHSSVVFKL